MLAWLHAVPHPPEGSNRQPSKVSRIDKLIADGVTPQMPPNPAPHIIKNFIEIGMVEGAGMGPAPLSWREIAEWQRLTRTPLAPWVAKLLRQLSVSYLAESRRAESETCPPPWRREITQREREADEARLRMVLG